VGKLEDEMTQRELEREYRQILDGGYVRQLNTSGVSPNPHPFFLSC